jgi:hypothetical protein
MKRRRSSSVAAAATAEIAPLVRFAAHSLDMVSYEVLPRLDVFDVFRLSTVSRALHALVRDHWRGPKAPYADLLVTCAYEEDTDVLASLAACPHYEFDARSEAVSAAVSVASLPALKVLVSTQPSGFALPEFALMKCVGTGNAALARWLMDAQPNLRPEYFFFDLAAAAGSIPTLELLLERDVDRCSANFRWLRQAVIHEEYAVLKWAKLWYAREFATILSDLVSLASDLGYPDMCDWLRGRV